MPGYDGTGPRGMGAMTGGGRGLCSPAGVRRASGLRRWFAPRFGRGGFAAGGYGQNRGPGLGRFAYEGGPDPMYDPSLARTETMSAAEGRETLQQQLSGIEDHLARIRRQLQATGE
ncbi:DUF5320 domain-containing protein [Candidatus Bipolaricaulota bacterium]